MSTPKYDYLYPLTDRGQCDTIKKNINQRGADTINSTTLTNYQKYSSKVIIKHANILDPLIKSHNLHLNKIPPYRKCTIIKYTYAQ